MRAVLFGIVALSGVARAETANHPVIHADGSIAVDGQVFPTSSAYFQSQQFRDRGRCGSLQAPIATAAPVAGDCSMSKTVINPAYMDDRTFVIQVVFHVIKKTDGTGDISPALLQSQIDVLNEDYGALPGTLGAPGTNTKIKFVLAKLDPMGNPTNGIDVVTNDAFFQDPGSGGQNPMKNALHWDTTRYLNIYTNDANGLLGYATFPQESAGQPDDGVVLLYSSVGRNAPNAKPYDLGRSATHEIGHYLGLFHTFQSGCGQTTQPYTSGDLISDTQRERDPQFGCTPAVSACGGGMNPIDDYMDYSDDSCMNKFTAEQANRLRCGLVNYRTVNTEPTAGFSYTAAERAVTFTNSSTDVETPTQLAYSWKFGDGETSTDANPVHTYAVDGMYDVTLEVVDPGSGTATTKQTLMVVGKSTTPDAGMSGGDDDGGNGSTAAGCCQAPREGATSFAVLGLGVMVALRRRRRR